MKRRLKNICTALCAFLCLAAIIAWGLGIAGKGFYCCLPPFREFKYEILGLRGGLAFGPQPLKPNNLKKSGAVDWLDDVFESVPPVQGTRILVKPELSGVVLPDLLLPILPYWLLILAFGVAPGLWLRRRHVERRVKKFVEEAVAAKGAEQTKKGEANPGSDRIDRIKQNLFGR